MPVYSVQLRSAEERREEAKARATELEKQVGFFFLAARSCPPAW